MGWPFAWNNWCSFVHFKNIIIVNCLKELLQNRLNKTIKERNEVSQVDPQESDLDSDDENYMDGNVMDPLYEEEADETNSSHDEEEFSEEKFQ